MTTLYVVPCGAAKQDRPAPAAELYTGAHFRYVLGRVREHAASDPDGQVVILSALHGLVQLDDVLAPYDTTMTCPSSITAADLCADMPDQLDAVELFLPRAYRDRLVAALVIRADARPGEDQPRVVDHYAGARGIGEQRARVARLARVS